MKILVSGATGFIGKHLIKELTVKKYSVSVVARPSSNTETFKKKGLNIYVFQNDVNNLISFMGREKFDGVVHLASLFLAQHKPEDVKELVNSNILFSTTLLEACTKSNVSWFINTGTFSQHYNNKIYSPANLYAATKQSFEDIAKYYFETSPINFVTLKLYDTFGVDDTRPKIFNLWSKIAKDGKTLDMSPGEQIIDISYIDNVVDGYLKLIKLLTNDKKKKLRGKSFALKSGERMSLKHLAKTFEQVTKTKLNINWGGREYRSREVMIPWKKDKNVPGWKPKVSLREGIGRIFNEK